MSEAAVLTLASGLACEQGVESLARRQRLRIFFVCMRVPFPPDRGDKIATFNLLRLLSRDNDVHVFCLGDPAADAANIKELGQFSSSVTAVPVSWLGHKRRGIKALLRGAPLSIALRDEPELHRVVAAAFDRHRPDLIAVYSSNVAQVVMDMGSVPRLMYFSDLDCLKWSSYAQRSSFPLSWLYRREAKLLLGHERRVAKEFSCSVVCTDAERADFEHLIPGIPVEVVQNGVDADYFKPLAGSKTAGRMVFTGVMDYLPNVDGVCWFCDAILPLVQRAVPRAELVICGRNPTSAVKRLASRPGVTVTGEIEDVRPFLDSAEICVVPLRIARGIQNKILEGMAMGLPCVASNVARQGLTIEAGNGILSTDDPEQFAAYSISLLGDGGFRRAMARKARAAIEQSYSWEGQFRKLDRIIDGLVVTSHRSASTRSVRHA